ncbi:response regulator transcription factor [Nocardia sp. NPDC051756]|uniref:response regulator transcription factor n=1 Tax=Nocardia sp. NPDC051756 TaxID=3154751 RepID=UPI003418DE28
MSPETDPTTSDSAPIRVLIADDEALVRAGFRVLVDSAPDLTVLGEAGNGGEAVRLTRQLRPDVVLMDIRMPIMDGLEAMRHIAAGGADGPHVLIVTTFDQDEHVFQALRSGASGFILKDSPPEELLHAIRVVAKGDALLTPSITRRMISAFARQPAAPTSPPGALSALTEREREVFEHIASGRSNAEIADTLFVSVATVKTHVGRLLTKLDVRDRAQLVVLAYETGIVVPGNN